MPLEYRGSGAKLHRSSAVHAVRVRAAGALYNGRY